MNEPEVPQKTYEIKLRILGNEVFAISLSSSNDDKWTAIGLFTVFSILTVIGAYGDKIVSLFKMLVG
jgi:hypothetical protein